MLTEEQINEITKQIESLTKNLEDRFQAFEVQITKKLAGLETRLDKLAEDIDARSIEVNDKLCSMADRVWSCENNGADPWD